MRLEEEMASPGFYEAGNGDRVKAIGKRMAEVDAELAVAEENWIEAQSELESLEL